MNVLRWSIDCLCRERRNLRENIARITHRSALDFKRAAHDLLLRQAADSLQEAKARHDQLERLYGDAVHSGARQALCDQAMKYLE